MYDIDLILEAGYWLRCNGSVYSKGINFSYDELSGLVYTEGKEGYLFDPSDDRLVSTLCDAYKKSSELITRYEVTEFLKYVIGVFIPECLGSNSMNVQCTEAGDGNYLITSNERSYAIILLERNCILFHSDKPGYTLFDLLSDIGKCSNTRSPLFGADVFLSMKDYIAGHCSPVEYLDETGHVVRVTYDKVCDDILVTLDGHVKEIMYKSGRTYKGYCWNLLKILYAMEGRNGNLEEFQSCAHGLRMRALYAVPVVESLSSECDLFCDAVVEYDNSESAVATFNTLYELWTDEVSGLRCFDVEAEGVSVISFDTEYGNHCLFKDSSGVFVFSNLGLSIVDCFREIIRILYWQDIKYYTDSSGHEQELQIID